VGASRLRVKEAAVLWGLLRQKKSPQHLYIFHVAKNYNLRCISVDLLLCAKLSCDGQKRLCEICVRKSYFSPSHMFAS